MEKPVQRLKCFRPSFNHPGKVPVNTRARLWRFPASRSRLPGLDRFLDTSAFSILLPHPPTHTGVSHPHRRPIAGLSRLSPSCFFRVFQGDGFPACALCIPRIPRSLRNEQGLPISYQRAQAVRSRAHGPRTRVTWGKGREAPRCDSHARRSHYFPFSGTEFKEPNFSSNGSTSS